MRKPAPLDTAAIERATRFDATIFLGTGRFRTGTFETLHAAREAAERFAREVNNGRKGMIYAITQDGRSVFVPPTFIPTERTADMTTTLSGTEIAKLTAIITGGGFRRANSKDSAEKRFRAVAAEKGIGEMAVAFALKQSTFAEAQSYIQSVLREQRANAEKAAEAKAAGKKPASAPRKPAGAGKPPKAATAPGAARKAASGKRAAVLEAAQRGEIPEAPDFTANTHKPHRAKLATVIGLVEKGDIAGLKAFAINPISSSPKAIAKYRDLAVIALEAQRAG